MIDLNSMMNNMLMMTVTTMTMIMMMMMREGDIVAAKTRTKK